MSNGAVTICPLTLPYAADKAVGKNAGISVTVARVVGAP